jgi:arrestin-related trafficking adapter 4/5/7
MIQANATQLAEVSESNENGQVEVPPSYERHQLDQLYDDIDPMNFMSGANTPFYGISRNPSHENLNRMLDSRALHHTSANYSGAHDLADLQSRLAELRDNDGNWNIDDDFAHPSPRVSIQGASSSSGTAPRTVAFRGSYHSHLHPPPHNGYFPPPNVANGVYDMEALARIPSYNTAVRTPVITPPSSRDGLPTYDTAISTPSSPVPQPTAPPRAHTRGGSTSGSSDGGSIRTLSLSQGSPPITLRPDAVHRRAS